MRLFWKIFILAWNFLILLNVNFFLNTFSFKIFIINRVKGSRECRQFCLLNQFCFCCMRTANIFPENIKIICTCYILFSPAGEVAHEDAWRTHVQYLLPQTVSFKPHIFNPTKKFPSELRKQHFFAGAYRVYQFSINSKVSRRFPSWHSAKFGERSRDRDTISFASRRAARRRGQNKTSAESQAFRKIHCAKKSGRERGGGGKKTKAVSRAAEGCVACHPIFLAGRCALRFFAYLPLFRPTPFPISLGAMRRRQSA